MKQSSNNDNYHILGTISTLIIKIPNYENSTKIKKFIRLWKSDIKKKFI